MKTIHKTWQKTKIQYLWKHKTGNYYTRYWASGKEIWKSLRTSHASIAKARAAAELKKIRQEQNQPKALETGHLTVGECLADVLKQTQTNPDLKPSTKCHRQQVVKSILTTWPELQDLNVKRVTSRDCLAWAERYRAKEPYRPPKAKRAPRNSKGISSSRFNHTVDVLRLAFAVSIKAGTIFENPAQAIKKARVLSKNLNLPAKGQFAAMLEEIERGRDGTRYEVADFLRFLAYSGCRLNEAREVCWSDVDFNKKEIVIRGHPSTRTKNWEVRRIPIIPDMENLLLKLKQRHQPSDLTPKVLKVGEGQKSMDRACSVVNISRLTHHDLRHLFATICIESGVDIPTVSRWLGHKDGGVLAMKTYGHLRDEHSKLAAQKVTFGVKND
ncbi:MAG: site-specific integrase [bacterium]